MQIFPAVKDPNDTLDYRFDFAPLTNSRPDAVSDWLASGETISSITSLTVASTLISGDTFEIEASSPAAPAITDTSTSVTFWCSGGVAGRRYTITCRITTSAGRIVEKSGIIVCDDN